MRNIIQLTAEDVRQAIAAYVQENYGNEVETTNVTFTDEHHGQYDDVTFEFTGAEVVLPDNQNNPPTITREEGGPPNCGVPVVRYRIKLPENCVVDVLDASGEIIIDV
jgi:hypothetical protein